MIRFAQIERVPDAKYCQCFTIKPSEHKDAKIKRVGNTEYSRLELLLNVNADQFWPGSSESLGVRVKVHEPDSTADMESGISISTGSLAEIAVVKREFIRTPHPYGSKCDYIDASNKALAAPAPDYILPLSQHDCSETVLALKIVEECECYDSVTLSQFMQNAALATVEECQDEEGEDGGDDENVHEEVKGTRFTSLDCANPSITMNSNLAFPSLVGAVFERCVEDDELLCARVERNKHDVQFDPAKSCVQPCSEVDYEMAVSTTAWPEKRFGARELSKVITKRRAEQKKPMPTGISTSCIANWRTKCEQAAYEDCVNTIQDDDDVGDDSGGGTDDAAMNDITDDAAMNDITDDAAMNDITDDGMNDVTDDARVRKSYDDFDYGGGWDDDGSFDYEAYTGYNGDWAGYSNDGAYNLIIIVTSYYAYT